MTVKKEITFNKKRNKIYEKYQKDLDKAKIIYKKRQEKIRVRHDKRIKMLYEKYDQVCLLKHH